MSKVQSSNGRDSGVDPLSQQGRLERSRTGWVERWSNIRISFDILERLCLWMANQRTRLLCCRCELKGINTRHGCTHCDTTNRRQQHSHLKRFGISGGGDVVSVFRNWRSLTSSNCVWQSSPFFALLPKSTYCKCWPHFLSVVTIFFFFNFSGFYKVWKCKNVLASFQVCPKPQTNKIGAHYPFVSTAALLRLHRENVPAAAAAAAAPAAARVDSKPLAGTLRMSSVCFLPH